MIDNFVLIIGAMKSGTTTLFDLLAQHPCIAPSRHKEPGFFAFEDRWAEGFAWYEGLFDFDPTRHRYGLEGSTDYTKSPFCTGVVQRLEASAPRRFKLIYLMRHPMRRIESHAKHVQIARAEVGSCRSPRSDHSLDAGISPVSLAISRYYTQLECYAPFHERGDLLVLTFEDLVARQTATLERVWRFLDLDPVAVPETHSMPSQVRAREPWYWAALSDAGLLSTAIKTVIPPPVRYRLRRRLSMRRIDIDGRFTLTEAEESALWRDLLPEYRRVAAEYDLDLERLWGVKA
jgi:hypothetical protein